MEIPAPTILRSRVRIPSAPSSLLKSNFVLYLSLYRGKDENKHKEAVFGPYFKTKVRLACANVATDQSLIE